MCVLFVYADDNPEGPDNKGPQKGDIMRVQDDDDPFETPSPTRRRKIRIVRMPGVPREAYLGYVDRQREFKDVTVIDKDGNPIIQKADFPARHRKFKVDFEKDVTLAPTKDATAGDDTIDQDRMDGMLLNKDTSMTEKERKQGR